MSRPFYLPPIFPATGIGLAVTFHPYTGGVPFGFSPE